MAQTPAQLRAIHARRLIELELVRRHPSLSEFALKLLADEAESTVEFADHAQTGMGLEVRDILDAVRRSETGQMVLRDELEKEAAQNNQGVDHQEMTAGMTPGQRINYARANGLL